ncbi:Gfo/Idh/MocA family protein [Streptomyces aculeolatus]
MSDSTAARSTVIRTAVVGLGWAGRSIWLPRLAADPAYEVVAVVDSDAATRAAAGSGLRAYADVGELSPADVDLAVVAVPNHLHSEVACRLLRRGVSVFVEKPVCLDRAEVAELAAAERGGGAVLLAGSAARYRADVAALLAAAGRIGRVRHVDLSWVRARGVPDAGGWFTRRRLSGGGALVDLGWHLLDAVAPLLGPVSFPQVVGAVSDDFIREAAHGASWRHDADPAPESAGGGDVEDTARGFLVTEDGVSVTLHASWASHEPLDSTVVRVEGSAGTATLRCTFGFSPNRAGGSALTVLRDGRTVPADLDDEPVGTEYDRQLGAVREQLADPDARGRAIAEAGRTIAAIERFYASVERTRRPEAALAAGR